LFQPLLHTLVFGLFFFLFLRNNLGRLLFNDGLFLDNVLLLSALLVALAAPLP
jgi:hypothetical protein